MFVSPDTKLQQSSYENLLFALKTYRRSFN